MTRVLIEEMLVADVRPRKRDRNPGAKEAHCPAKMLMFG